MKSHLLIASLLLFPIVCAHAESVLNFEADQLLDANGTPVGQNGLVLVVADTNNTGFAPIEAGSLLAVNSDISGTGNRIVGAFDLSEWGGNGAFENPGSQNTFNLSSVTNWTAGDNLELVWLPTDTLSSTDIAGGTTYGTFSGTGSNGVNWTTPADGSNVDYQFFTQGGQTIGVGNFPDSDALASQVVQAVPEPGTYMMLGLGLLLLVLRTRSTRARI